jgi:phosphoribosylamine--glycine ligase
MKKVEEKVVKPTIRGIEEENIDYVGFVFFGLICVQDEPYVIEYNCRMGDPETEVVMPRLASDLGELLIAAAKKDLQKVSIKVDQRPAATVMAVSRGYPLAYDKGFNISGIDERYGAQSMVFQAGTKKDGDETLTSGGRVLCVTSYGEDLQDAVNTSLDILDHIDYEGMYYRTDIGYEFK